MTELTTLLESVESQTKVTVEELVDQFVTTHGLSVDQAARSVYQLWQQGDVKLWNPNPPRRLHQYLRSWYTLWFWLVVSTVIVTALSIYVIPQFSPFIYLRIVFGGVSVLYLPGSALIHALYPQKADLEPLERFALSIGLSLALVPLLGLFLNYTPWGIQLNPVFTSLAFFTLIIATVAVIRQYGYFRLTMAFQSPHNVEKG